MFFKLKFRLRDIPRVSTADATSLGRDDIIKLVSTETAL